MVGGEWSLSEILLLRALGADTLPLDCPSHALAPALLPHRDDTGKAVLCFLPGTVVAACVVSPTHSGPWHPFFPCFIGSLLFMVERIKLLTGPSWLASCLTLQLCVYRSSHPESLLWALPVRSV